MTKKSDNEIGKAYTPKISEDQLQKQVAAYLTLKYPDVLWCHVPNGGSRNLFEAVKLKAMGVKPGVPDVMIFSRRVNALNGGDFWTGCAIELKVGKNKPSEFQNKWAERLLKEGWRVCLCYTFDEARSIIDDYLVP